MDKINIAVIGTGNMGRHHINHYHQLPEANLVAVVDPHSERRQIYAEKHACNHYESLADLLNNETIHAVSIANPTSNHFETAQFLIKKGVHVLIEKPISETPEEAEILIALAEKHNVRLMVGHIERFNPIVISIKKMIDADCFGKITSILLSRMSMMPTQIKDSNVFIDLAVHDIDLCSHLLGETPHSLDANAHKALLIDRVDYAAIFMKYPSQASASIHVNWICPRKVRTLTVLGSKGYAEVDLMTKEGLFFPSEYITNEEGIPQFKPSTPQNIPITDNDALQEQIKNFLESIQKGITPLTCGIAGKNALLLALTAQKTS
jgi:UDP-N-acetylglucosamine 3-dehydrogenase